MMARIYANENFPLPVVERLRELGHDVLTTHDVGASEQAISDAQVLAFAASQQRCVLTLNRKHFIRLHHDTPTHAGIIVCTFDPDFRRQAERIHRELEREAELDAKLLRVNCPPPDSVTPPP